MKIRLNGASISNLWQAMDKAQNPPVPKDSTYGELSWNSDTGEETVRCTFNGYFEKDLAVFAEMKVPLIVDCDMRFDVFNRDNMVNVSDMHIDIDQQTMKRSLDFFKQANKE